MDCCKVMAFVEGTMERIFVNNNFKHIDVVSISNGKSWTTKMLCSQIVTRYKAKGQYPDSIVVWLDREENPNSVEEISEEISNALELAGYQRDKVFCLISDKMCENLILADESVIRSEFSIPGYSYPGDGWHGKAAMKSLYIGVNQNYKETIHGVSLLKKIRLSRLKTNNPGIVNIVKSPMFSNCWWVG